MRSVTIPDSIKVVIVGDSNVGKTSIINRYVQDIFTPEQPNTIGVDFFAKKANISGKTYTIQIWDTAGQERFKSVAKRYIKTASAALLVFDLTEKGTFERTDAWLNEIEEELDPEAPIILVGNKCDLVEKRVIEEKEAKLFAKKRNVSYFETSAQNTDGVHEVFQQAVQEISKRSTEQDRRNSRIDTAGSDSLTSLNHKLSTSGSSKQNQRSRCC